MAASLPAQESIGLSSVRAKSFLNEAIGAFPVFPSDYYAWSLVTADFNGDGALDLATGVPNDDGPFGDLLVDAGAVIVRWGSPGGGLASQAPTLLTLYAAGGQSQAYAGDRFGYSLAAGDFNRDGLADLAVGIPGYGYVEGADTDSGAVQIHYGEPTGIQLAGEHFFHRTDPNDPPFPDPPGNYDEVGHSLAAGDFDGDGYSDLAIGAPAIDDVTWNPSPSGGAVIVLHGGIGGLRPVVGYVIHQDDPPVPDDGEDPDDFGWALAAGNFNGDLRLFDGMNRPLDDLAMSAPGEDGIGAVMVMLGNENGLIFANSVYYGQGDLGGVGEADDRFGSTLASGNFNGDINCPYWPLFICTPMEDLAIGTPKEDLGASNEKIDAGEVTVVYGAAAGFFNGIAHLQQGSIQGSDVHDESGDLFGSALAAGDFDRDGRDDLAVGQPGENSHRGGVTVVMGGINGFDGRHRLLETGSSGLPPDSQSFSDFGRALAAGDFDKNGFADLAIGIPYRDEAGGLIDIGAETILYGALFADGFEGGSPSFWLQSP